MRRTLIAALVALAGAGVLAVVAVALRPDAADVATGAEAEVSGTGATASDVEQVVDAGDVQVSATLRRLDDEGAAIDLALDTHTTDLDVALPEAAGLTVDGTPWEVVAWDGDPPGGHHRAGTLRFAAADTPEGEAELTVEGLPEPVRVAWTVD